MEREFSRKRNAVSESPLEDLEVDVDEEVGGDWLAFEGRGLEAVLTDGLDCFFVEAHADALYSLDVRWMSVGIDY